MPKKNASKIVAAVAAVAAGWLPLASQAAEYAAVISSTPVTTQVVVPRQVCSDELQRVQPQPSGAGAVIGAIAGGLLGNAVGGHGAGRAAATGLGAVVGAGLGNSVEMNGYPPAEVPVRRCQTVSAYENRTLGYEVVYEYAGQRYTTRMARDPGAEIAIDVRPSGAARPDRAAPLYAEAAPGYAPAPRYAPAPAYATPPVYAPPPDAEQPVYDAPQRAYYRVPPAYIVGPAVGLGIGLGYWASRRHHHGHRGHWR